MNDRLPEPEKEPDYTCPYCNNLQDYDELLPQYEEDIIVWECSFCHSTIGVNDIVVIEMYW